MYQFWNVEIVKLQNCELPNSLKFIFLNYTIAKLKEGEYKKLKNNQDTIREITKWRDNKILKQNKCEVIKLWYRQIGKYNFFKLQNSQREKKWEITNL